ncbi:MAG: HDOD domain-containing protein [Magnetococcus sp. WYHC-3]
MPSAPPAKIQRIRDEVAAKVRALPALPVMCRHILATINNRNVDFETLARQCEYDPGMTANVLRIANSAYFRAEHEIGSLRDAFVRIGSRRLFELTVGHGAGPMLREAFPGYELRPHELLRHSAWTAAATERLAVVLKLRAPDMLFTAGLLHDIGKVVLDPFVEAHRAQLHAIASQPGSDFEAAEREVLGMDHAQVGAAVLRQWRLPTQLVAAVEHHHNPAHGEAQDLLAINIVHVANTLAGMAGVGAGIAGTRHTVSAEALQTLHIKTTVLERVASSTFAAMEELEQLLK